MSAGVPTSVYVTFIAMNVVGAMMALALAPPTKVVRPDGTRIAEIRARTYREEIRGLLDALKDWRICLMVSMREALRILGETDRSVDTCLSAFADLSGLFWLRQRVQKFAPRQEPTFILLSCYTDDLRGGPAIRARPPKM